MTFPTKADIEFFKEAKRIQELWEPKFGHWVLDGNDNIGIVNYWDDAHGGVYIKYPGHIRGAWYSRVSCIFLPRQGQLQEMLVEKEGYVLLDGPWSDGYNVGISDQATVDPDDCKWFTGPTPSIALGKCLLEVLKEE